MTIIPWQRKQPTYLPISLQSDANQLSEGLLAGGPPTPSRAPSEWTPPLSIEESDNGITVTAEIPGTDPSALRITVHGHALTIIGEKKYVRTDQEGTTVCSELRYGAFKRRVVLPREVVTEDAAATVKNGVLTLSLPKRPHAKSRPSEETSC